MRDWVIALIVLLILGIVLDGIRRWRKTRRENIQLSRNVKRADKEFSSGENKSKPSTSDFPSGGARIVKQRAPEDLVNVNSSLRESFETSRMTAGARNHIPQQVALKLDEAAPVSMEPAGKRQNYQKDVHVEPTIQANMRLDELERIDEPVQFENAGADARMQKASAYVQNTARQHQKQARVDKVEKQTSFWGSYGPESSREPTNSHEPENSHEPGSHSGSSQEPESPEAPEQENELGANTEPALPEGNSVKQKDRLAESENFSAEQEEAEIKAANRFKSEYLDRDKQDSDYAAEQAASSEIREAESEQKLAEKSKRGKKRGRKGKQSSGKQALPKEEKTKKEEKVKTEAPPKKEEEFIEPEEVLIINVSARNGEQFYGPDLLNALMDQNMKFGEMNIFYRHKNEDGSGPALFGLANMVMPGTFSLAAMHDFTTPGLSMFLSLPLPPSIESESESASLDAYNLLVRTAQGLTQNLGGMMKDENRSVMTLQTIEHGRQRVIEYQRKRRLAQR